MEGWGVSRILELAVLLVCYSFALIQALLPYSTPLLLLVRSIYLLTS